MLNETFSVIFKHCVLYHEKTRTQYVIHNHEKSFVFYDFLRAIFMVNVALPIKLHERIEICTVGKKHSKTVIHEPKVLNLIFFRQIAMFVLIFVNYRSIFHEKIFDYKKLIFFSSNRIFICFLFSIFLLVNNRTTLTRKNINFKS